MGTQYGTKILKLNFMNYLLQYGTIIYEDSPFGGDGIPQGGGGRMKRGKVSRMADDEISNFSPEKSPFGLDKIPNGGIIIS